MRRRVAVTLSAAEWRRFELSAVQTVETAGWWDTENEIYHPNTTLKCQRQLTNVFYVSCAPIVVRFVIFLYLYKTEIDTSVSLSCPPTNHRLSLTQQIYLCYCVLFLVMFGKRPKPDQKSYMRTSQMFTFIHLRHETATPTFLCLRLKSQLARLDWNPESYQTVFSERHLTSPVGGSEGK